MYTEIIVSYKGVSISNHKTNYHFEFAWDDVDTIYHQFEFSGRREIYSIKFKNVIDNEYCEKHGGNCRILVNSVDEHVLRKFIPCDRIVDNK